MPYTPPAQLKRPQASRGAPKKGGNGRKAENVVINYNKSKCGKATVLRNVGKLKERSRADESITNYRKPSCVSVASSASEEEFRDRKTFVNSEKPSAASSMQSAEACYNDRAPSRNREPGELQDAMSNVPEHRRQLDSLREEMELARMMRLRTIVWKDKRNLRNAKNRISDLRAKASAAKLIFTEAHSRFCDAKGAVPFPELPGQWKAYQEAEDAFEKAQEDLPFLEGVLNLSEWTLSVAESHYDEACKQSKAAWVNPETPKRLPVPKSRNEPSRNHEEFHPDGSTNQRFQYRTPGYQTLTLVTQWRDGFEKLRTLESANSDQGNDILRVHQQRIKTRPVSNPKRKVLPPRGISRSYQRESRMVTKPNPVNPHSAPSLTGRSDDCKDNKTLSWGKEKAAAWKTTNGRSKEWRRYKVRKAKTDPWMNNGRLLSKEAITVAIDAAPTTFRRRDKTFRPASWAHRPIKTEENRKLNVSELLEEIWEQG
jgi:hypothetical protein